MAQISPINARPWEKVSSSQLEFDELVTQMYTKFYEAWGDDIRCLLDLGPEAGVNVRPLRTFRLAVRDLRHGQQHEKDKNPDLFKKRQRQLREFCGTPDPSTPEHWEQCHNGILDMCTTGLEVLVGIVNAISNDSSAIDHWREATSSTIDLHGLSIEIIESLGLQLRKDTRDFLARSAEKEWSHSFRKSRGTVANIDDVTIVIERVILGWSLEPLPCNPYDIIDIIGASNGLELRAGLAIAHGLAELIKYDDADGFVDGFEKVWNLLGDAF